MKKLIMLGYAILIGGALLAPARAQEEAAAPAQVSPAAPAAADGTPAAPVVTKRKPRRKRAKKPQVKNPAVEVSTPAVSQVPVSTQAAPVAVDTAAPAAKPEPGTLSSCPHCFQPLLAGYKGIIFDLAPWMEQMDVEAAAFDHKLSDIQKQINEKDKAVEQAKLIPDKKAMKEAVKVLNKERKLLLKQYSKENDAKDAFYKWFSKTVEKKTEGYNNIVESKLKETQAAANP